MNIFIKRGSYNNNIYYGDIESVYIEKKYSEILDKANLVGEEVCQGENGYETGGLF